MENKTWKDILGWEGLYQVSDSGDVLSLDRIVLYSNGSERLHKGQTLSRNTRGGYPFVELHSQEKREYHSIHRLIRVYRYRGMHVPNLRRAPK